jgi:hypothetical protein
MQLLQGENLRNVSTSPGVYKILSSKTHELLYVGETRHLRQRLTEHTQKSWDGAIPLFSYVQMPDDILDYQRHEIENDLIGAFYGVTKRVPRFQMMNHQ